MNERYRDYDRHSCYREYHPRTKKNQTIKVNKGGKICNVVVTEPNGQGSNIVTGTLNGKTVTCWHNSGSWSINQN